MIALRFEPEPDYVYGDGRVYTYFAYYYDECKAGPEAGQWKLFAVGQKFRKGKISSLFTRAFIEVPGVAEKERSGHAPREVSYRGYVRDVNTKEWVLLDRMKNPML